MTWLVIVKAGVLRLETVDSAVEAEGFGTNFGNEVTGDMSLKAGRVVGFWIREYVTVDERGDGFFMHDGCVCRYTICEDRLEFLSF